MGAADGVEVRRAVAPVEVVGGLDPLARTREVPRVAARNDRVAARQHDGVRALDLASERAGHGLVQQGDARLHSAHRNQRGTQLAQRAQLQIAIGRLAGDLARLAGPPLGRAGVILVVGRDRPAQQDPTAQRLELELLHEPRRPGQPSTRSREVAQAGPVEQAEVDRRQRRLLAIRPVAKRRIRALEAAHRRVGLAQPPQDIAETKERLGRLLPLQRGLERGAGSAPVTRLDRPLALAEKSFGLRRHGSIVRQAPRNPYDLIERRRAGRPGLHAELAVGARRRSEAAACAVAVTRLGAGEEHRRQIVLAVARATGVRPSSVELHRCALVR